MFSITHFLCAASRAAARAMALCATAALIPTGAQATAQTATQAGVPFCVFDPIGNGDTRQLMLDYAVAMLKKGHQIQIKTYVDERVAVEDFRTGQCHGVVATGLRTRTFLPFPAAVDSVGASTILRDGKVDLAASFQVLRQFIEILNSPKAQEYVTGAGYELGGIAPLGAIYPFVNDRSIATLDKAAGKRVAAFDHDKSQAQLIQRVGARPVAADITNFATMFNNGQVDIVMAPGLAYKPLELYRGIGTKGGVARFPVVLLTVQAVVRAEKFAPGFGKDSRAYFTSQFDEALRIAGRGDKEIPEKVWIDSDPRDNERYLLLMRQGRVLMAEKGYYDKRGLKLLKKIRCSVQPAAFECSELTETW